jgi:hypothetical protein
MLAVMTDAEIQTLIRETARTAVKETFIALGADVENPLEMQEDFAWMRRYRQLCEKVGSRIVLSVVTILTGGIAAAIWANLNKT